MKTFKRVALISTVVAAFATAATVATPLMAQAPNTAKSQPGQHQHREPRAFSKPTERVEARLAYQRTALKITPQQQTQWERYAAHARKQAQDMEQRFAAMPPRGSRQATPRPNAIQRLERQQSMLSQASSRLNERLAVQKPLYAALSPEQQRIADQVLSSRGGGKRGHVDRGDRGGRGGHRFGHMG